MSSQLLSKQLALDKYAQNSAPPQVCHLPWVLWGNICLCFQHKRRMFLFPLFNLTADAFAKCGKRPEQLSSGMWPWTKIWLTVTVPGQRVLLSSRDLPLWLESNKLPPRYVGPFEIIKIINPSVVKLKPTLSIKKHPTFQVSLHKPVSLCPLIFLLREYFSPVITSTTPQTQSLIILYRINNSGDSCSCRLGNTRTQFAPTKMDTAFLKLLKII